VKVQLPLFRHNHFIVNYVCVLFPVYLKRLITLMSFMYFLFITLLCSLLLSSYASLVKCLLCYFYNTRYSGCSDGNGSCRISCTKLYPQIFHISPSYNSVGNWGSVFLIILYPNDIKPTNRKELNHYEFSSSNNYQTTKR